MAESNSLHAGQKIGAGRFTLVKPLGRGGMGEVWLAQDERLNEPVALKFLPPEVRADPVALDDLRRETARSHKLSHPNIVRIHDLHEDPDGTAFIVMEYIDGSTLAGLRLQQPSRVLSWEYVRPLVEQLCAALDYAHGEKVIHRDLKPANIMVDEKGRLKLADFGIAAVASDSMSRISMRHSTSGTLPYMSPQQLTGERPRATDDIYALGATIYELLTGKPPFHTGDITHQILNKPPEPMEERLAALEIQNEIPGDVGALIMACLAKEPGQRPQSARAVAEWIGLEVVAKPSTESLAAALFPESQSSPASVASEPAKKAGFAPAVLRRSMAVVGTVALVMAGAFWLWKGSHQGDHSNAPAAVRVPPQTTEMEATQKPSVATPKTTADITPSTPTEPQPPSQATALNSAASSGADWISPQVPKAGADGWFVLFDGKRLYGCSPSVADVQSGRVSVQDGCLRLDSIGLRFNLMGRDMVIRARLKMVSGQNCGIRVRSDGKGRFCAGWFAGGNRFGLGKAITRPQWKSLAAVRTPEYYNGFFEMEVWAEGENLSLKADGQNICKGQDNLIIEGAMDVAPLKGITLFKRIEGRILDKQ